MREALQDPIVLSTIFGGIFGLLGIVLQRQHRTGNLLDRVAKHTEQAREQVQNSHKTNLRDDIDRLLEGVERLTEGQNRQEATLERHGSEISGIRKDARVEREERISVSQRLDNHIDRPK